MSHILQDTDQYIIGQGAVRVGDFKLMFAPHFNKDGWYNPDARPRKMRMVVRLMPIFFAAVLLLSNGMM